MVKFNLVREIRELKNQLSYSKKYGFFFGAGTSCALGVPNIAILTTEVEKVLKGNSLTYFNILKKRPIIDLSWEINKHRRYS